MTAAALFASNGTLVRALLCHEQLRQTCAAHNVEVFESVMSLTPRGQCRQGRDDGRIRHGTARVRLMKMMTSR